MQYVSVADPINLVELDEIRTGALLSLAVFIGKTRLIDNFILP
jgi:pantothenate synthetase